MRPVDNRLFLSKYLDTVLHISVQSTRQLTAHVEDVNKPEIINILLYLIDANLPVRVIVVKIEEHIQWVGFQRDVNAQLQQMDLFVLPSLFDEGLPMVVLESMAMGIPVIGTDVEGVPEAICDGIEGRVARAGDPLDLANSIADVMDRDGCWLSMQEAAIRRQNSQFSDRTMAQRLASVYDEILVSVAK